ncbi:MAG: C25 family cysteine peptidase, partial [Candidatus Thermoplasmatota archaeon]|nr:C25 family cysteine peptidase [Candidatus Thermoplasmatota archaeon]
IVCIILVLLGSSFSATAFINQHNTSTLIQQTRTLSFSPLVITTEASFVRITLDEATSSLKNPGEPILPKITYTFSLPLGSIIAGVNIKTSTPQEQTLMSLVAPAFEPLIDGESIDGSRPFSHVVYESNELYPSYTYETQKSVGLKDGQHMLFYSIHYYPVQYNPVENKIYYSHELSLTIDYSLPSTSIQTKAVDQYDLFIIYPEVFAEGIQPLIDHKNNIGMRSYGKTLEEIYLEYPSGRDKQEKIKLSIKDAIETGGITYVLLVGGLKGQSRDWYLPVRYAHSLDETYVSDLYYADIYKDVDGEIMFEDWDSNGNGKFAEFGMITKDIIDGAPDVYVGRLACRSKNDVSTIVNKIITYEKTKADESWFKHMLLIGGDTYPYDGIYTGNEAEIYTNVSASYMEGFTFTRLWASTGTLTGQEVVEDAINQGAGFIHMAGHANPSILVTHPPFQKNESIVILQMYNLLNPSHIHPKLTNKEKLPVIVVGGCHNSQFNVSLSTIFQGIKEYGINGYFFQQPYKFYHMEWVPKCWSWWLTINPNGGAIATIGNTGLGMGLPGEDYVTGLNGWLLPRFFYRYGQEEEHFVGMAFSSAITDYVHEFDINKNSKDRQMVQQWALLGDPSLLPGGYS